jgi:hypothetical protein
MKYTQGFVDSSHSEFVCRLRKFLASIYGVKQAPRAWFTKLGHDVLDIGLYGSQVDHSPFIYHVDKTLHFPLGVC